MKWLEQTPIFEGRRGRWIVLGGVSVVTLLVLFMRFSSLPTFPDKPAPPVVDKSAQELSVLVDSTPLAYRSLVEAEARRIGVSATIAMQELSAVMPHRQQKVSTVLIPKSKTRASLTALGLELSLGLQKSQLGPMMVLSIRNTRDVHVAYRVVTRPSRGTRVCHGRAILAHNAVALRPGETIVRSECVYKKKMTLEILEVETIEIPAISYRNVSAVAPSRLGLDARATRGHEPPDSVALCSQGQAATLEYAMRSGRTTWRDLVDFFARHSCRTYSFPDGYRAFTRAHERDLPVTRLDPASP